MLVNKGSERRVKGEWRGEVGAMREETDSDEVWGDVEDARVPLCGFGGGGDIETRFEDVREGWCWSGIAVDATGCLVAHGEGPVRDCID